MANNNNTVAYGRNYDYREVVKRLFAYIYRARINEGYINQVDSGIRKILDEYVALNRDEKYRIFKAAHDIYRATKQMKRIEEAQRYLSLTSTYDSLMRQIRKVKASSELRTKQIATKIAMQSGNFVFYLCSKHNSPAEDHKNYQGRIYIDRFWRQKVDARYYRAVAAYVRNHKTITVQEITGAPVYLTTRPYCKHYLIPMRTETVLTASERKLAEQTKVYAEGLYDDDYYFSIRAQVYSSLDSISPCISFKQKVRSSGMKKK